jgi:two-component system, chemotaxis family, chemotaxis protein CheY
MNVDRAATRVLVVDDNDFTRETVAAMLHDIGFRHVLEAGDGLDALRRLDEAAPGLVICDVAMQPMDGLAFVEGLRRHPWLRAATIPVIFLTVHTETAIVRRATELGVEGYVVKPVDRRELETRISAALDQAMARPPG